MNSGHIQQELHRFCDASEQALASVIYVCIMFSDEKIHCAFVMGKSRIAPLKRLSSVRLELQAAVLAVRLFKNVSKELSYEPDNIVFWSDNKVVLAYIANKSRCFHVLLRTALQKSMIQQI